MNNVKRFQTQESPEPDLSESVEIESFATSRNMRVISVLPNDNHWYYWLRGNLHVSNLAHFYVVIAELPDGTQREIHVAFDSWAQSKGMKVLVDRKYSGTAN